MNWIFALVRVVGASFPGASSLVQLQAEIDSQETQKRLRALEDPLAALHPDIRSLSEVLYSRLCNEGNKLHITDDLYSQYRRPFHILDAHRMIHPSHVLGRTFPHEVWVHSADYVLYMAALFEDPRKMDALVERIDSAEPSTWIHGDAIANELSLPLPVVKAVLQLYERRGLGWMSREARSTSYFVKA